MGLFVYKCDVCSRIVEEFRPSDKRLIIKPCGEKKYDSSGMLEGTCSGKLIFQPVQKTHVSFKIVDYRAQIRGKKI